MQISWQTRGRGKNNCEGEWLRNLRRDGDIVHVLQGGYSHVLFHITYLNKSVKSNWLAAYKFNLEAFCFWQYIKHVSHIYGNIMHIASY